jgi:hypothetical protein
MENNEENISDGVRNARKHRNCDDYKIMGRTEWCRHYKEKGCSETCYFARNKNKDGENKIQ